MIPIAYAPRIDRAHPVMIFCAPCEPALATEAAMERWNPKRETTRHEEFLLKRLHRTRKLFGFLRRHRHELFDDQFQADLEAMYRATGAGQEPVPPALLAMVVLLQSYLGTSDAEAVELAVVDLRWQMVLGCLGATEPPFSQGALPGFRERLIAHDMDRRLLGRARPSASMATSATSRPRQRTGRRRRRRPAWRRTSRARALRSTRSSSTAAT